jgi:hypothetical protein
MNMLTDNEVTEDLESFWNPMNVTEEELDDLKKEVNEDPIFPRQTNVIVVEYNIRPVEDRNSNFKYETLAFECEDGSAEDEELMHHAIATSECCLLDYDIEGESPTTHKRVIYDRAVVRTKKPKEYWINHFR